jgi:L-ribulose-5-phosphate 4-epimerase
MKEGVIKYQCERVMAEPVHFEKFEELNRVRNQLWELGLIGIYPNGVGYGNVSVRCGESRQFYISGAATGHLPKLDFTHYAKVRNFDIDRNWVKCEGPIQGSSESMTHAAIYEAEAGTRAVLHVHNPALWNSLLDKCPTTAQHVEYGTPEMAREIMRLFRETDVREQRIIAMAGHEDGVIAFGETAEMALGVLMGNLKAS